MENDQNSNIRTRSDRKKTVSNIGGHMGKLPPQAIDLEEAVLGALMLEKDALSSVIDVLKPETFYVDANHLQNTDKKTDFVLRTHTSPVQIHYMEDALKKEGVLVKDDVIVNFKKHFWDPRTELL